MERTLGGGDGLHAEAGQPLATASDWDLTDAEFTYDFDEQEDLYRVTYDSGQASPTLAVLTVVSNITGIDPLELDPLSESIDTDALDAQFTADVSSVSRLTFQYSGCEITVGTDDVIEVVA